MNEQKKELCDALVSDILKKLADGLIEILTENEKLEIKGLMTDKESSFQLLQPS